MIDHTTLGLYRQTLDRYRLLKLGPKQAAELLSLAELGLEARGKVLADPTGLPDSVICALEMVQPTPRRRRVSEPEPA